MPNPLTKIAILAMVASTALPTLSYGSSHMDAPLITFDDPANTTDVYAFRSTDPDTGEEYLTVALSVYPFEEPGIGPNTYRFDDRVEYNLHVALDNNATVTGDTDLTYSFRFNTRFVNQDTILQNYLGVIPDTPQASGFFGRQNMRQAYTLRKIEEAQDGNPRQVTVLGTRAADGLIVPPNNQGQVTPFYNQGDDGDMPAKEGVSDAADLDPYTKAAIAELESGYRVFAGQRDDGFYADIQSIFDLDFSFGANAGTPTKPFDSQGGFNVHTIVLDIPMEELGDAKLAGIHATTRRATGENAQGFPTDFVQVGRQGNPLFAEALIANLDKDRYNQTVPAVDDANFATYAEDPELGRVLGVSELIPGLLRAIYIPDVIKVDLTTEAAKTPNDPDFNRLSIFGGDVLDSSEIGAFGNGSAVPGGWPNGRRFGDDVIDIALIALGAAGPGPFEDANIDRVSENDITYHDVFPYAATPHNGRNHVGQVRDPNQGL
ncbi:MAG: DUF4331 domain-containing protein [Pseudomonadota bacterium]